MTLLHFLIGCFVANHECVAACPRMGSRTDSFRGQFALVIAVNCGIWIHTHSLWLLDLRCVYPPFIATGRPQTLYITQLVWHNRFGNCVRVYVCAKMAKCPHKDGNIRNPCPW